MAAGRERAHVATTRRPFESRRRVSSQRSLGRAAHVAVPRPSPLLLALLSPIVVCVARARWLVRGRQTLRSDSLVRAGPLSCLLVPSEAAVWQGPCAVCVASAHTPMSRECFPSLGLWRYRDPFDIRYRLFRSCGVEKREGSTNNCCRTAAEETEDDGRSWATGRAQGSLWPPQARRLTN